MFIIIFSILSQWNLVRFAIRFCCIMLFGMICVYFLNILWCLNNYYCISFYLSICSIYSLFIFIYIYLSYFIYFIYLFIYIFVVSALFSVCACVWQWFQWILNLLYTPLHLKTNFLFFLLSWVTQWSLKYFFSLLHEWVKNLFKSLMRCNLYLKRISLQKIQIVLYNITVYHTLKRSIDTLYTTSTLHLFI